MDKQDWADLGKDIATIFSQYTESAHHMKAAKQVKKEIRRKRVNHVMRLLEVFSATAIEDGVFISDAAQTKLKVATDCLRQKTILWKALKAGIEGVELDPAYEESDSIEPEAQPFKEDWQDIGDMLGNLLTTYQETTTNNVAPITTAILNAAELEKKSHLETAINTYLGTVLQVDLTTTHAQNKVQTILSCLRKEEPDWKKFRSALRTCGFAVDEPFPLQPGTTEREFWDENIMGNDLFTMDQQREIAEIMASTEGVWNDPDMIDACYIAWEARIHGVVAVVYGRGRDVIELKKTKPMY